MFRNNFNKEKRIVASAAKRPQVPEQGARLYRLSSAVFVSVAGELSSTIYFFATNL